MPKGIGMSSSECSDFHRSIRPGTLDIVRAPSAFDKMSQCLRDDFERYILRDMSPNVKFAIRFRTSILGSLRGRSRQNYKMRLRQYRKLAENQYKGVEVNIPEFEEWNRVQIVSFSLQELEVLEADIALRIASFLSGCISQLFFSMERSCRVACALGTLDFARKVATHQIIQHQYVFDTLKTIARADFRVHFGALSRMYAYSIKARMLSDYTLFFFDRRDTWRFIPSLFLPVAENVFKSERTLMFECLGE